MEPKLLERGLTWDAAQPALEQADSPDELEAAAEHPSETIVQPQVLQEPAGEQEGGDVMLEFSDKYTNTTVPSVEPRDQAYAALYLASEMGKAVTGQVIQVDNGGFL